MVSSVENRSPTVLKALLVGAVWLVWQVIRWPLFALLVVLEPVVRVCLSTFAVIGTLCALMMRFTVDRPHFPFWGMLGISLSCIGVLALYYASIRFLSGR